MAIEEFLIEENKTLITEIEELDKWNELIEKIGAKGQKDLVGCDKSSPIPFINMNSSMQNVYSEICKCRDEIEKYSKTAIPVKVLSLIALSKQESYFDKIEIWYDDIKPDPLAIGIIKKDTYSYEYYIIARWGDELRSFPELQQIAQARYKARKKLEMSERVEDLQRKIATIDIQAEKFVNGHYDNLY